MYSNNREAYREAFFKAWQKFEACIPLLPFESMLVTVIQQHPEYHAFLSAAHPSRQQEFTPETNPFIHMSLHLSLEDQLRTERPAGIQAIYATLLEQHQDPHQVQHLMMRCLADTIWDAQARGEAADENCYMEKLRALCASS